MKTIEKFIILFFAINSIVLMVPQKASAQISINFQVFYDDLSPYGFWVNNPDYGYVWVPEVSDAFIPYGTNGYWAFTNMGWTWVSNYSWGWAPFHYGRWFYDPYYGWIWVPGYEWGPGWVTWRVSQGYYGWAPIGPGISISFAYSNSYRLPYNQWIFVRDIDFGRPNINKYYIPSASNITIINNSTVINNVVRDNSTRIRYNAGPSITDVQRRTRTTISPKTLRERSKPGQKLTSKELGIYRPRVEKNRDNERKLAPSKVIRMKDLKPVEQRQPQQKSQPERQQAPPKQGKAQPQRQEQPQHKAQPERQQTPPKQDKNQPQQRTQPERQQVPPKQDKIQPVKQEQPQHKSQPSSQQHKEQGNTKSPKKEQQFK